MEFNNKKLNQTSKIVNYIIASLLCIFLISLTSIIIGDLNRTQERPRTEDYIDHLALDSINTEIRDVDLALENKWQEQARIENKIRIVENEHSNKKQSFENWLEARKTVGSQKQDKEVLKRANELDVLYETVKKWRNKLVFVNSDIENLRVLQDELYEQSYMEENIAMVKRDYAYKSYELNVFLIRLAFVLPILLIGIWFIVKFRKHKYWPLFLGFVLFSFYAFFFGLLPYLPSYGGYVRYTVGIILSIAFGIYFINVIRKFIERKKQELTASQQERSKTVKLDTAEKALDNHMCPSCGKDFILVKWDKAALKVKKTQPIGLATNFCRFCGLELFKKCKSCDTENFAHLPYCSHCGDEVSEKL